MFRHVIAPVRSYTKAANELVRHRGLNSDAKILLLYVQGLPGAARDKPLGEHASDLGLLPRAYQRAKKGLTAGGFLHEWRAQDRRGRWSTSQLLSNVTLTREEAAAVRNGAPAREEGGAAEPSGAKPAVGSPRTRTAGHLPPEEEDRGKTPSHPPTEEAAADATAPGSTAPEVETAERLLLSLRHQSRDLLLGVREARGLAEAAAEWLRRGVSVAELRHALTSHLPGDGVRSAVGFLRHRLTEKLPQRPPEAGASPAGGGIVICEGPGREHTFRQVGDETRCRSCRRERAGARAESEPGGGAVVWRDHFDKVAQGLVT
ncbi:MULTISPECIES: hypothetical protein [unclassified Streptomyces]|uniref:hypothetical protein n=1 Tax=unclassified Streptomyces TaxID=2593676 RepID=UPI0006AE7DFF|nr:MULTISPECIES: hypothetical protein [unclassified Streptomyces]